MAHNRFGRSVSVLSSMVLAALAGCGGSKQTGGDAGKPNGGDGAVSKVAKADIGAKVFDQDQIQSYYLTLSEAEYARLTDLSTLLQNPYTVNEDRYVKAALRVGDTELPSIGLRYKGNYSIWGCVDFATGKRVKRVEPMFGNVDVCQRFSLKLDFNKYDDSSRVDGLKKLNLHAMAADASKMRERLGYALFRDSGLLASRATHARVYINGVYHGLFLAVEEVDGRFTANRFPEDGDGNLYRDVWPTPDLDTSDVQNALRTNNDPDEMDVSDFLAMRDALAASTDADFATRLAPFVDFDQLARYFVIDRAIANSDGALAFYFGIGWGPRNANYFWYNVGGGRFTLIPWDFDKAFIYPEPNFWSDNAPNGKNIVPNWNVITDGCNGYTCSFDDTITTNGVARSESYGLKALECDPFLRRLRAVVYDRQKAMADAFLAGPFSESSVDAKLTAWRKQVEASVKEDSLMDSTKWQGAVDDLRSALPKLRANLSLMMSGLIHDSGTSANQEVEVNIDVTNIETTYLGRTIYLALFAAGSTCDSDPSTALYLTSHNAAAGSNKLNIPNVRVGSYTACTLIDADGNMTPSPGDKAGMMSLSLPGDAAITLSAADWTLI
jgi:spore coat protein CotH